MRTLRPQNYISSTPTTEEYECSICNYIAEKPYRCLGPCKKVFCQHCINCLKHIKNQCPFKCSHPFQLSQEKEVNFQYRCPFNSQRCTIKITSLSDFYNHPSRCEYVPEGWREKQENYSHFRCDKGHPLFYLGQDGLYLLYQDDFYQKMLDSLCDGCKEKGLCRAVCPQCSTKDNLILYCTNCRKPPCTKTTCFNQHPLRKVLNHGLRTLMCDFCGTAVYLYGPYGYSDRSCNFDICEACYEILPQTHQQVPFKMSLQEIQHLRCDSEEQNAFDREIIQRLLFVRQIGLRNIELDVQESDHRRISEPNIMPLDTQEIQIRVIHHVQEQERHQEEEPQAGGRAQVSNEVEDEESWWARLFCCCFKASTVSD